MANQQVFEGFCEGEGLDVTTRRLLAQKGISNVSDLALLTDAVIDTEFREVVLVQRLKLKETARKAKNETVPRDGCLDRTEADEQSKDSDVRFVLLGKTGNGKSSSGNTILGSRRFQPSAGSTAQTATCNRGSVKINGVNIRVVDTPGIMDPKRTLEEVSHEVSRCLDMTSPGPHAFLYVLPLMERITEEDLKAYTKLRETFGANLNRYTIVVFTRGDQLQKNNTTIEKVLADGDPSKPSILTRILTDVDNRYVVFSNTDPDSEVKDRQVGKLLRMVAELRENNVAQPYFKDEQAARNARRVDRQIDEYVRGHPGVGLQQAYEAVRQRKNEDGESQKKAFIGLAVLAAIIAVGYAVNKNK